MSRVEQLLAEYPDSAITTKLLRALYGAVPMAPAFAPLTTMEQAVRALRPDADASHVARARDIADRTDEIGDILWMGNLMDSGDKGYAVLTGLSTAWRLFKGQGSAAFENDDQQRNDAVLKALGLAYMAYKAFPGSLADKARLLRESTAGQALVVYYGAVEVALPFADNAASLGAGGLEKLLASQGSAQAARLAQMGQGHDLGNVREMLTQVTSQLQSAAGQASNYIQPMTAAIAPYIPGGATMGNAVDKAAGAVASAADVLPVYRLLAARLAAESAARRALSS
jgi:hypothetical protein